MATSVKFNLTLSSDDLTTDVLSLQVNNTDSSATKGGLLRRRVGGTATGSSQVLIDEDDYVAGARVFVRNCETSAGETVSISLDGGSTEHLTLEAGEWALFPWAASNNPGTPADIHVFGKTITNIVEYGVFE